MLKSLAFSRVFLLLFEWITISLAVEYGPSLDNLIPSYSQNDQYRRKEIYLETYFPSYSVVLPLANGSTSGQVARVHPNGEFTIHAPPDHGLMVVIQALRLRTSVIYNEITDATFLKCRDFLKFNAGNQSSQVCGQVVKLSKDGNPLGMLGSRTFITPERQLSIGLYVDSLMSDNDYGWHESITVELVITAFKECPKITFVSQWRKWTGGGSEIKSCSPSEDRICISSGLYCDGVVNCGVKGPLGHIGYDEENCKPYNAGLPFLFSSGDSSGIRTTSRPLPISTQKPPYIGVNKPYTPPTQGKFISPIHLILIFSIIVLIIFGTCTWLAKANEKKFQHTMYRFSTMRRNRRNQRQRGERGTTTNLSDSVSVGTLARFPSAPPQSTTNSLGNPNRSTEVLDIPGEEPPPYNALFPPTAPPIPSAT